MRAQVLPQRQGRIRYDCLQLSVSKRRAMPTDQQTFIEWIIFIEYTINLYLFLFWSRAVRQSVRQSDGQAVQILPKRGFNLRYSRCPPTRKWSCRVYGLVTNALTLFSDHQETILGRHLQRVNHVRTAISLVNVLDASTHLYMRVCPSVRWSVGPSVHPLVTS